MTGHCPASTRLRSSCRNPTDAGVRITTAFTLGSIRSSPEIVLPALVETFLKDEDPDVRNAAMTSIGRFGADAKIAIPLLREAAKDPNLQSEQVMQSINRLLDHLEGRRRVPREPRRGILLPPGQGLPRNEAVWPAVHNGSRGP